MAFVKIDKSRQSGGDQPLVTMGAYLADGKVHKGRSVAFRISRVLMSQLRWAPDDGARIRIGVFEGTDKDVGFLQLMLDESGYAGTSKNESSQGISINVTIERFKHYVLNECPISMQVVTHVVDGDALVIECPDWLRFNPASVPAPEPEPSRVTPILNREQRRALATRVARNLKR